MISAISSYGGMNLLGIYGNPSSIRPIKKISADTQKNAPLVTASIDKNQNQSSTSSLGATKSTSVTGFGDILKWSEKYSSDPEQAMTASVDNVAKDSESNVSNDMEQNNDAANYFNDTIGVMGFQNALRYQLTGYTFNLMNY